MTSIYDKLEFKDIFQLEGDQIYLQADKAEELSSTSGLLKDTIEFLAGVMGMDQNIKLYGFNISKQFVSVELGYSTFKSVLKISNRNGFAHIESYSVCYSIPRSIDTSLLTYLLNAYTSIYSYILIEDEINKYLLTKFSISIIDEKDAYLFAVAFIDQLQNSYLKAGSVLYTLVNKEEIFTDSSHEIECLYQHPRLSGVIEDISKNFLIQIFEYNDLKASNPYTNFRLSVAAHGEENLNSFNVTKSQEISIEGLKFNYSNSLLVAGLNLASDHNRLTLELEGFLLYAFTTIDNPTVGKGLLVIITEKNPTQMRKDIKILSSLNNVNSKLDTSFGLGCFTMNPLNPNTIMYSQFIPSIYGLEQGVNIESIIRKTIKADITRTFTSLVAEHLNHIKQ